MKRLRILTWHIHGNYLYYLSSLPHDIYLPRDQSGRAGYGGKGTSFPFPENVIEIDANEVRNTSFDCVLFQSPDNYLIDRNTLLSAEQRSLPAIYLEHDPPRNSPTDTVHPVDDASVLVVHVTHFNALMWDNRAAGVRVIEHGVHIPDGVTYDGSTAEGIVVVNNLGRRGRRLGADIYESMRRELPLTLVGMGSETMPGGHGEVAPMELAAFEARFRFFLNPIRWTSCGLAVIEAMLIGMPVVALATTEMATVLDDGVTGFIDTNPARLVSDGRRLLGDRGEATRIGAAGREVARDRFGMHRFVADWNETLAQVCATSSESAPRIGVLA